MPLAIQIPHVQLQVIEVHWFDRLAAFSHRAASGRVAFPPLR